MDYSKTHYYKFSSTTQAATGKPASVPDFEQDEPSNMYGIGMQTAKQSAKAALADAVNTKKAASEASVITPQTKNTITEPGLGPEGSVTPALPGDEIENAEPGMGPIGSVTPSLPGGTTGQQNSGSTAILWSWAFLSPLFSNVSSVARARFYNAAAILEPIDIYINGQLLVSDLGYSEYTDYLYIIPGYYTLTIYSRTNLGAPIINARVNFARSSNCLVSILGTYHSFSLQFIC